MTVLRNVPISLTPEEVLQAQRRNQRGSAHPALVSAAQEAVAMSQALVVPAAVYDEFLVRDVAGEQMVIGMGPGYESPHVGSVCCYCSLADTCWRRRED